MVDRQKIISQIKSEISPSRDANGNIFTYPFGVTLRDGTKLDSVISRFYEEYLVSSYDQDGKLFYESNGVKISPHHLSVHNYLSFDHVVGIHPSPHRIPDRFRPGHTKWEYDRGDSMHLMVRFSSGAVVHLIQSYVDGFFWKLPEGLSWSEVDSVSPELPNDYRDCIQPLVAYRCLIMGLREQRPPPKLQPPPSASPC